MALTEYPAQVSKIDYASFLEIERLQYKKGLEKAGGATETLLTSGLAGVLGGAAREFSKIYNTGAAQTTIQQLEEELAKQQGIFQTSIADQSGGLGTNDEIAQKYESIDDLTDEQLATITDSNGQPVTRESLKEIQERAGQRRNKDGQTINIALPNEMSYGYGASWNNTFKIGTLAMAFNSAAGLATATAAAGAGAGVGALLEKARTNATKGDGNFLAAAGGGAAKALNPYGINSNLNPASPEGLRNLAGLSGMAPNENAVQFFSNIEFREFTFDFEIFTPGPQFKQIAEKLIKFFKQGMHPSAPAGTGVLKFPDVYIIRPKFKPEGKAPVNHSLLPQSKSCALTNLRVNTTPMNSVQTTYDGTFPLITISVTFKELTALTREDLEKGY